mmetsp:Transcript_37391/g.93842  ORF Transcript_37391/g.93842 Transcript_37391/m.93842 type:complete len:221 (-) Transcript_37391:506-1168(-)
MHAPQGPEQVPALPLKHAGFVAAAAASNNVLSRQILGVLRGVQHTVLLVRGRRPRVVSDVLRGAEVPHLQLLLRPPRTAQDLVALEVHGVTGDVRPEARPDRNVLPYIPDLDRVVPAPGQDKVGIVNRVLERKHAVAVSGLGPPVAPAQGALERLRRLVVDSNLVVLAGGRKLQPVGAVVQGVDLVVLLDDGVEALHRRHVPVPHRAVCVDGEQDVLGAR